MSSGQWEVVGKNKKDKTNNQNNKNPVKNDSKTKKPVPVTKVEDILPMSQVNTIYSNIGKSNKENKKPQEKENKAKEVPKKNAPKKADKSPEIPKSKPPKSIESALNMINVNDFKECFEKSKQHFPEGPLVWLKELAAYFNSKINLEVNDSVFSTKSDGYPLNTMPAPLKQIMDKAIQEAGGKPIAQVFFDNSVTAMANDMSKGLPAIGHKLWIQYLSLYHPQITSAHFEKHSLLRTSYQNRQQIGLSILWALGQGGLKDFHTGLKVFKEFMLPLLEMKNYSRFIVKYLSQHLNRHSQIILSKENYFFIFDLIHTRHSVPNEVNTELGSLNKKLNSILFAKTGDKKYSTFFDTLLLKLNNTQSKAFVSEVTDVLTNCLKRDTACYGVWKNVYAKNYEQSWILLKYISDNWNKINNQLDKKCFKEMLQHFVTLNAELIVKTKKNSTILELEKICKTLICKMTVKKSLFPWKFIPLVLFIAIGTFIFYDINHHGSWRKAQSVRTLKNIGVWEYGEKAWVGANQGFNWTRQRIEEYAPGYFDATAEFVGPYIDLAADLSKIGYNAFIKMSDAVWEKVPIFIESIEKMAPGLLDQIKNLWFSTVNSLGNYWEKSVKYITTEVFVDQYSPENMQKIVLNAVDVTQKYAVDSYNWAYEKIQTAVNGK